jgi:hypothetical protein
VPGGMNPQTGRPGPAPKPARDGDREQARQRVNVEVRTGRRPHPNTLPCADCQHEWKPGERRHEYDHFLGYDAVHHGDVQPVCTRCHSKRSFARGEVTPDDLRVGGTARAAKRKTHCLEGHPMSRSHDGEWRCRECRLRYWRERYRKTA